MKNYKEVVVEAMNAPTGSYAAGCPVNERGHGYEPPCLNCERTS